MTRELSFKIEVKEKMEVKENPHHLVLGKLKDFLSGNVLSDTHDERHRQKIAKLLVEKAGFLKQDIASNIPMTVTADSRKAILKIDFIVTVKNKKVMMVKYAPGSLVTRRLSTLALSRVAVEYQIPYVVITNGESAEIIAGDSGKVIVQGLDHLPDKKSIEKNMARFSFKRIDAHVFEQASRIAYACEIDGACPCDTDICVID